MWRFYKYPFCLSLFLIALLLPAQEGGAVEPNTVSITLLEKKDQNWHKNSFKKRWIFGPTDLELNNNKLQVESLKTRGQSCMIYSRRCFVVKLLEKGSFHTSTPSFLNQTKKFYLISLAGDLGYIHMMIGYNLLAKANLFYPHYQYTELLINDRSQGLYLAIQDPDKILEKRIKAQFVGRRGYGKRFNTKQIIENASFTEAEHQQAYHQLLNLPNKHKGEELYKKLKQRMDIDQYMQWLAINYLVKNGDYTDEVFFYSKIVQPDCGIADCHSIYFQIMGWDMDDLFRAQHSSKANYIETPEGKSVRPKLKKSLLYSREARLDKAILDDAYLYTRYQQIALQTLLEVITEDAIKDTFARTKKEIEVYLDNPNIHKASRRDRRRRGGYNKEYILTLLESREKALYKRRKQFLSTLQTNLSK